MTEINTENSNSDISIDSWTLLEDNSQNEDQISKKSSGSSVEIIDIEPEVEEKPNLKTEESEKEGFLSFDEFFQEKMLQLDYEHAEKAQKKGKKRGRKLKTPKIGISVFISILLGLTIFATLRSTLSQSFNGKKTEEIISKEILPKTPKQTEEIFTKFNQTIKRLETFKFLKEIEQIKNDTEKCPKFKPPRIVRSQFSPKSLNGDVSDTFPKIFQNITKSQSSWTAVKDFLLDTNFHAILSLIMTNIYLFNQIFDLRKKTSSRRAAIQQMKQKFLEGLEKSKSNSKLRRYLFKELPFRNVNFLDKKQKKSKSTSVSKIVIPKKTTTMTVLNEKDNSKSCPFLAQRSSLALFPSVNEEAGKSECQKRFDELDHYQKKFEELKQNQKSRVKLLKQKFKNEVSHIKDTEEESEARAEKISRTSQKFIKKLKFNRERYLLELKKVKELRQKVTDAKQKENMKEVSTGSYKVGLSPIYDYGEKFKLIKEKFEKENLQLPKDYKF